MGSRPCAGRIIPAYAGSTWRRRRPGRGWSDHPRIRGEHLQQSMGAVDDVGSSPHTRGAPRLGRLGAGPGRIIPAYAGSTWPRMPTSASRTDHPRIRGEHPPWFIDSRGWLAIIPAYAGSTLTKRPGRLDRRGSSPHTRGAPGCCPPAASSRRIIPAYAGSTPLFYFSLGPGEDHPRIRGEHPRVLVVEELERGIIPAYAGSTRPRISRPADRSDHPRIRGEHIIGSIGMVIGWGSSPHTRGAPVRTRRGWASAGIIPAYAGSTPARSGRRP